MFLEEFCDMYPTLGRDYDRIVQQRGRALEKSGAKALTLKTAARTLVGLGLPHSIEVGFLLDRLTGSPYLPGSSVKGLMRAVSALAAADYIEGNADFWMQHRECVFGRGPRDAGAPEEGGVVFYDAFPTHWPRLEVEILTPHYGEYYLNSGVMPGDWENPVPVPLLGIAAETEFDFYYKVLPGTQIEHLHPELQRLYVAGLATLGIGGKKSSGYGVFDAVELEEEPEGLLWPNAVLIWFPNLGAAEAKHEGRSSRIHGTRLAELLTPDAIRRFGQRREARADLLVRRSGNEYFVLEIQRLRL